MLSFWWHTALLQLGDTLAGAGLPVVLTLCSSRLDAWAALGCLLLGLCIALAQARIVSGLFYQVVSLLLNLALSLSVCLSLFIRLCPPEGRELSVIPVYALLCTARPRVTRLSGAVLGLMVVAFVAVFLLVVRMDPGVVDAQLSEPIASSGGSVLEGVSLVLVSAYGSLSHLSRAYSPDDAPAPLGVALACGGLRLAVFAAVGLGRSAFLSLFLSPTNSLEYPHHPNYLAALYGVCLLFACMHMASAWFEKLKALTAVLSGRAYTARRLIRLQHILNAGLVGTAWAFPLHSGEALVIVAGGLLALRLLLRLALM